MALRQASISGLVAAITLFEGCPSVAQTSATASPPVNERAAPDAPPLWSILELDGWKFLDESSDSPKTFVYAKAALGGSHGKRLWVRFEYESDKDDVGQYRGFSHTTLIEADCAEGRLRYLETYSYRQHNLKDTFDTSRAENPQWDYIMPGTLGEDELREACAAPRRKAQTRRKH